METIYVLVVENEHEFCKQICNMLESIGYKIWNTTSTVSETLKLLQQEGLKPDIALVDIELDDDLRGGIKLGRIFRTDYGIPVMYLTNLGDEATRLAAFDTNYEDFIDKPPKIESLKFRIQKVLQRVPINRHKSELGKGRIIYYLGDDFLLVKNSKDEKQIISLRKMICLQANGDYTKLIILGDKAVPSEINAFAKISDLENILCQERVPNEFLRIHNSYIINVEHIVYIDSRAVDLKSNPITNINIGRKYAKNKRIIELREQYKA